MTKEKPFMIIARAIKGKGASFLEDKEGWHGKTLSQEDSKKALVEIGEADTTLRGKIPNPNHEIFHGKFSNTRL